jgi:RNA recognition motif-containing protein
MNIYVGNLNYHVKENDLKSALEEFGTVDSVKIITDRETGRSKGYGFVEMPNDEEAGKVLKDLNGADFEGRTLVIKEARPRA